LYNLQWTLTPQVPDTVWAFAGVSWPRSLKDLASHMNPGLGSFLESLVQSRALSKVNVVTVDFVEQLPIAELFANANLSLASLPHPSPVFLNIGKPEVKAVDDISTKDIDAPFVASSAVAPSLLSESPSAVPTLVPAVTSAPSIPALISNIFPAIPPLAHLVITTPQSLSSDHEVFTSSSSSSSPISSTSSKDMSISAIDDKSDASDQSLSPGSPLEMPESPLDLPIELELTLPLVATSG